MSATQVLKATLRTVTPVFCAGAEQNGPAEIRPLSLRGALRWWYRAIDPNFAENEARFFGATGARPTASPVTLRVENWVTGKQHLRSQIYGKSKERGEAYLGYTLYLGANDRRAVPPDQNVEITLRGLELDQELQRAWLASLWLFGHLGGLGTRSRRGYGTMALESWSNWPEANDLAPAYGAANPEAWLERFRQGLKVIRGWFPGTPGGKHHHLGARLPLYLWKAGQKDWSDALHVVGQELQQFRSVPARHTPGKLAPFGLPLAFQHPKVTFFPQDWNRAPSRLQIRVVRIGERYHPLVWCAAGSLVPDPPPPMIRPKPPGAAIAVGSDGILDDFLKAIAPKCL